MAAAFLALTAACFHRAASVRGSLRAGACFLNPPFWHTQSAVKTHPGFVLKISRADRPRPQGDALTGFAAAVSEEAMMSECRKKWNSAYSSKWLATMSFTMIISRVISKQSSLIFLAWQVKALRTGLRPQHNGRPVISNCFSVGERHEPSCPISALLLCHYPEVESGDWEQCEGSHGSWSTAALEVCCRKTFIWRR